MLLRPSYQGARGKRPMGPFSLNRESSQALNLESWWPIVIGDGGVLRDRATSQNHAPIQANPSFQTVPDHGLAMHFDGTAWAQSATIQRLAVNTTPFTLSLWLRAVVIDFIFPVTEASILEVSDGAGRSAGTHDKGLRVSAFPNMRAELVVYDGAIKTAAGTTAIVDGTPHLITGTFDGSTLAIYVDGRKEGTTAASGSYAGFTTPQWAFAPTYPDEQAFYGDLWDARYYYNRCLTEADVWALYDPATRWDLYRVPSSRVFFDLGAGGGGGTVTGIASATGSATVTGVGARRAAAVASSTGQATVAAVGRRTAAAVASSTGQATVAAVGKRTAAAVASSTGQATVAAVGRRTAAAVASSTGQATVAAVGRRVVAAIASSTGQATVTAVGRRTAASIASSTGNATATAVARRTAAAVASSTGQATAHALGTGGATVANSTGAATATAVGARRAAAISAASGHATVTAVGQKIIAAVGTSQGQASTGSVGRKTAAAAGASTGHATVTSVSRKTVAAIGAGTGTSVVTGISPVLSGGRELNVSASTRVINIPVSTRLLNTEIAA